MEEISPFEKSGFTFDYYSMDWFLLHLVPRSENHTELHCSPFKLQMSTFLS